VQSSIVLGKNLKQALFKFQAYHFRNPTFHELQTQKNSSSEKADKAHFTGQGRILGQNQIRPANTF
jgi:hypothetical protein